MKKFILPASLVICILCSIRSFAADAEGIFAAAGQKGFGKYECSFNTIEGNLTKQGKCIITRSARSSSLKGCEGLKSNYIIVAAINAGKCKFTPEIK